MQEITTSDLPEIKNTELKKASEWAKKYPEPLAKFKEAFPRETEKVLLEDLELTQRSVQILESFIEPHTLKQENETAYCDPCKYMVTSCCWTQVPANFNGKLKYCPRPKFIYDTSCLRAVVTECLVDVITPPGCPMVEPVTFYQVRIVGCIPWMASALWKAPDGICGCPRKVDVCCRGSVCVDNPICMRQFKEDAEAIAAALNGDGDDSLKNCENVPGMVIPFEHDHACLFSDDALVKFWVIFGLPHCPTPS